MIKLTKENKNNYINIILDEINKIDPIIKYAFKYLLSTDEIILENKIELLYKWINDKLEKEYGCIEDHEMLINIPTEFLIISSFPKLYLYTILVVYDVDATFDYENDKFYTDITDEEEN